MLCSAASAQVVQTNYKELPNFHKVSERLYRGAQPRSGGYERLAELGIKTVVNLRLQDARAEAEETDVQEAGLQYFNISIDRLGHPDNHEMDAVLSIITAPENQPVFIHCRHGEDRTGVVVAAYRIAHEGWTGDQAKEEAFRHGMKFWLLGRRTYIDRFYRRHTGAAEPETPDPGFIMGPLLKLVRHPRFPL